MGRIAIVSDIHGNRTAFAAILEDLKWTAPDLVLHGGDLADSGSGPKEIVDQIRDLGWPGVAGNTDEMLFRPQSLYEFVTQSPRMEPLAQVLEEMAAATRAALGEERLSWLRALPGIQLLNGVALVHASPGTYWSAPAAEASDGELESVYGPLGRPVVVYSHIHRPYIREAGLVTVANTGSVSLSYDGDPRAAYLLLDDSTPSIRRVEYDLEKEVKDLRCGGLPHAGWIAHMLLSARPQGP